MSPVEEKSISLGCSKIERTTSSPDQESAAGAAPSALPHFEYDPQHNEALLNHISSNQGGGLVSLCL